MDFRDTPEEAEFRAGLREWLHANIPGGVGQPGYCEPEGDEPTQLR